MNLTSRLLLCFIIVVCVFPVLLRSENAVSETGDYRVFTSQNGQTIEAKVTAVFGGTVTIERKDGKSFKFKGSMLSEEDRTFLIEWSKKNISYHVTINHRSSTSTSQLSNQKGLSKFQLVPPKSTIVTDQRNDGMSSSFQNQENSTDKRHLEISLRNLSTGDIDGGSVFVRLIMIRRTSQRKGTDSQEIVQWEGGTSFGAFPKAGNKSLETDYSVEKVRTRFYHSYDARVRNSSGGYDTVSQTKLDNIKSVRDTLEGIQVWVTHGNKVVASDHEFSSVLKGMPTFEASEDLPERHQSIAARRTSPKFVRKRMPGEPPPRPGRYVLLSDGTFKDMATRQIIGPPRYRRQENGSMMDSITKRVIEVPLYQYLDEGRIKNTETGEIVRVRLPKPRAENSAKLKQQFTTLRRAAYRSSARFYGSNRW